MRRRGRAPARRFTGVRWWSGEDTVDLDVSGGVAREAAAEGSREVSLAGLVALPGLVNADDHLELSTMPPPARPPYRDAREWTAELLAGPAVAAALALPEPDRLFLGGVRNLLAGVTAVLHHGPFHRSLGRDEFPVRVQERYQFAASLGTPVALRRAYRSTDRRIPFVVHAGEGTAPAARGDLERLAEANVLRHNAVLVHAQAIDAAGAQRMAAVGACAVWCPEADARLYGATLDVATMRQAGVRVGLGTDSAAAGARDALSNLAAARATSLLGPADLLEMATVGSATVARMTTGVAIDGPPADFVAVTSTEALLAGDRRAIALVVVRGEPVYGRPELLEQAGVPAARLVVDGEERSIAAGTGRRLRSLLGAGAARAGARWLAGVVTS